MHTRIPHTSLNFCCLATVMLAAAHAAHAQCPFDELDPPTPGQLSQFGYSGAIHNDFAIVGSPFQDLNQSSITDAGVVDLFRKAAGNYVHDIRLTSPNPASGNNFGAAVDVHGNIAIVGEPNQSVQNFTGVGQAHLYYRNASNQWVYGTTFSPAAAPNATLGRFGASLDIDGDYMIIGMPGGPTNIGAGQPGNAYLYKRNFGYAGWDLVTVLFAPWTTDHLNFGHAVAVQHGTTNLDTVAVVGIPNYAPSVSQPNTGRVHLYTKPASGISWTSQSIMAPDASKESLFGSAVAVDGDVLVIGAPAADVNGLTDAGAVYIRTRQPGTSNWTHTQKLLSPELAAGKRFGHRVAIEGDWLVAAEELKTHLFRRSSDGLWQHEWTIRGNPQFGGSTLVGSVGISGDCVLATNPKFNTSGINQRGIATVLRFNANQGSNSCETAPLIDGTWVAGCTHTATRDGSSPCDGATNGVDVWHRWIAPCDGVVTIDTQYSDFNTLLSVHSQCPDLAGDYALACNDDFADGEYTSALTLTVQEGNTYLIRVASKAATTYGWYILNVNMQCGPACAADIAPQPSGDGAVNVSDLLMVINNWGSSSVGDIAPPGGDGIVNVSDLLAIINAWGACQ